MGVARLVHLLARKVCENGGNESFVTLRAG